MTGRDSRERLIERAKGHIALRLRDPDLSIEGLGAAVGVSKRYLHKLFQAGAGDTLGRYILARRLDRCRDDLLNPALSAQSITAIAFNWGFNDASHFSHTFKRRFGVSPKAFRLGGGERISDRPRARVA